MDSVPAGCRPLNRWNMTADASLRPPFSLTRGRKTCDWDVRSDVSGELADEPGALAR